MIDKTKDGEEDIQMLKNYILIENGNDYQCEDDKEVVEKFLGEDFYSLNKAQKQERMRRLAVANMLNNKKQIIDRPEEIVWTNEELEKKFVIENEYTYILSLLIMGNVVLLEKRDGELFANKLDLEEKEGNYVIVNNFAKKLLKDYLDNKMYLDELKKKNKYSIERLFGGKKDENEEQKMEENDESTEEENTELVIKEENTEISEPVVVGLIRKVKEKIKKFLKIK